MTVEAVLSAESVVGRVLARGEYTLTSAAHFGGEPGLDVDMALLRGADGQLLIPGASIAGACRSFLAHYLFGDGALDYLSAHPSLEAVALSVAELRQQEKEWRLREEADTDLIRLFGSAAVGGRQSTLIVHDAYMPGTPASEPAHRVEVRDGVTIAPVTGHAESGSKYDREVLAPGSRFLLRFELVMRRCYDNPDRLKALLDVLLAAFEVGDIRLGARTRRGLGQGRVKRWEVQDLDFTRKGAALDWLRRTAPAHDAPNRTAALTTLVRPSHRRFLDMRATFTLPGALLVRSYTESGQEPDAVQLLSGGDPILPGTSVAGVLRHRAERILRTLLAHDATVRASVDHVVSTWIGRLFGYTEIRTRRSAQELAEGLPPQAAVTVASLSQRQDGKEWVKQRASRLRVEEQRLQYTTPLVQTRIRIDRFTGGTMPGALFDEAPLWGSPTESAWQLRCHLSDPLNAEIGLCLLLLKDLWLGDLPLGGGAAIGRGVLHGRTARLTISGEEGEPEQGWEFAHRVPAGGEMEAPAQLKFTEGRPQDLQHYVDILNGDLLRHAHSYMAAGDGEKRGERDGR